MRTFRLALLALALPAAAQEAPLFADDAPLDLVLAFDRETVTDDRSDSPPWYPATLTHRAVDGAETTLDLGVRTRGYYRLRFLDCDVPPLRLNVRQQGAGGTVFESQDKLKLVTHCKDRRDAYEQYVLQEELLYRAYALLTDLSFRTRLARVTYRDVTGEHEDLTRWGFLIEDDDRLAERVGGRLVSVRVHPESTDLEQVTLLAVFQYMIGNTDWAVSTLHNTRLVYRAAVGDSLSQAGRFEEMSRAMVAVPYDFDFAGLVDTPYATPAPDLNIRSVRQRTYIGFCRSQDELRPVLERFRAREAEIYALFRDSPYLDPDVAEDAVEYLEDFFDDIRTDRDAERAFRDCLRG